jgi:hypothetical protein
VTAIRHPSLDADWMPATPVPPGAVTLVAFLDDDRRWRVMSSITEWRLEWRSMVGDRWHVRARCRRLVDLSNIAGRCCAEITPEAHAILDTLPETH